MATAEIQTMERAGGRRLSDRRLSLGLHTLWLVLSLGANRIDRALRKLGAPRGTSLLLTVIGWNSLLLFLERRRPADSEWNADRAETATDVAFNATVTVASLGGHAMGETLVERSGVRRLPGEKLGIPGGLAASLLVSDSIHYSMHRLGHEWGPAWKFHSVHHSPKRLNTVNATRFHPVELGLEGFLEGAALTIAGFSNEQMHVHRTARATYGQLQHCNIALDSGPMDHVLATPDLHRWHHSEIYEEGDNNYGAVVSVWDRLFGSFFRPGRHVDSELGVGRMPNFPQTYGGLLATPFRWEQIKADNADAWYADNVNPDVHARS